MDTRTWKVISARKVRLNQGGYAAEFWGRYFGLTDTPVYFVEVLTEWGAEHQFVRASTRQAAIDLAMFMPAGFRRFF